MIYRTNPMHVNRNINQYQINSSLGKIYEDGVQADPPPRRASANIPNRQKLYIAIIDTEYRPSKHHCLMREAWINDVEKLDFVDGIEIYSNVSYSNDECQMKTISFPSPSSNFNLNHNPSCTIIRNLLSTFLNRSDAGWLLYLTDSSFVNVRNLKTLIKSTHCLNPIDVPAVTGQCVEMRDYFQVFQKNSGSLISRKSAMLLTADKMNKTWDVSCQIEIDFAEAIAHALDINSLYAIMNDNQLFLGNPFVSKNDYDALLNSTFSEIKKCPVNYKSKRVCHPTIQPFKNLAVWSGVGEFMNKYEFMEKAKKMFDHSTNFLAFIYNTYHSELCKY